MSRDARLYLEDILEACERIRSYVADVEYDGLLAEPMRLDAVVRNLEVIGEAARQLPEQVRAAMPEVSWRDVIGMRNVLIHAYFGVDPELVWNAATYEVEVLAEAIQTYLGTDPS